VTAMNLGELEKAVALNVQDQSLQEYYNSWINTAILELAAALELPALKTLTPTSLSVTTATWLFALPTNFQKILFRCADVNYNEVKRLRTIEALDQMDIDHDETGDNVTHVAVTETQIGVYPKANDTLRLWYYMKPTVLTNASHVPTCIPEPYHARVIIPKVIIKAYEHLQDQVQNFDQKGLEYWRGKLAAGLRGSPVDGPGLVQYLNKIQGGSKRTGGRDPVGARIA
jgi:hypothetical protein